MEIPRRVASATASGAWVSQSRHTVTYRQLITEMRRLRVYKKPCSAACQHYLPHYLFNIALIKSDLTFREPDISVWFPEYAATYAYTTSCATV